MPEVQYSRLEQIEKKKPEYVETINQKVYYNGQEVKSVIEAREKYDIQEDNVKLDFLSVDKMTLNVKDESDIFY